MVVEVEKNQVVQGLLELVMLVDTRLLKETMVVELIIQITMLEVQVVAVALELLELQQVLETILEVQEVQEVRLT